MPLAFVRYTPEIERIDPDLDRILEQILDFWQKKVRESPVAEGSGRAVRGAHAKTYGVVKAEVQILRNVPPAYAQGIYARPGRHGALIRFSSASNHLGADATLGGVLGLAMKIFDIPGAKLVEDEPDSATFDLVLKNNPVFIANTAKHYLVHPGGRQQRAPVPGARQGGLPRAAHGLCHRQWHVRAIRLGMGRAVRVRQIVADTGTQPAVDHVLEHGCGASRRLHGEDPPRAGPGKHHAGQSIENSTCAVGRTCSIRPWPTNCRPAPSTSTFRSSCAPISRRCRSTTRRSNGRRRSLPL